MLTESNKVYDHTSVKIYKDIIYVEVELLLLMF